MDRSRPRHSFVYDSNFYERHGATARTSAHVVLPMLFREIPAPPASVVDVGCGVGAWLAVARELGVAEVHGIDGGDLPADQLEIPADAFERVDLERFDGTDRRADIAICLEVAEHLDPAAGRQLVRTLTSIAPVVAFSAAIPGQGGTHHVNEQWPGYWSEQFADCGFGPLDVLRARMWNHPEVAYYYAQNLVLYLRRSWADANGIAVDEEPPLALVHPELLDAVIERSRHPGARTAATALLGRSMRPIERVAGRLRRGSTAESS